jgi:hypothetical protein
MDDENKITGAVLSTARDYADAILMGPLKEFGGILSDTVGAWRLRNQVRILLGAKKLLEDNRIDPQKILPDVFVPLLEQGSMVSDDGLSEMFSSLLAEHLDPSSQSKIHPSFAHVLSQLSPIDAKALLRFWNRANAADYRDLGLRGGVFTPEWLSDSMAIKKPVAVLVCLNLARLGLIEYDGADVPDGHPIPELFHDIAATRKYRITDYGIQFAEVCNRGKSPDPFA